MSFEEEFDNIIRRKAEDEHYPFDQSNWDKASGLLDAERKAAGLLRLKRFYLPAALLVILGSAGFVTYSVLGTKNAGEELAVVTETSAPAEKTEQNTSEIKQINSDKSLNENITTNTPLNTSAGMTSPESSKNFKTPGLSESTASTSSEKKNVTAKKDNSIAKTNLNRALNTIGLSGKDDTKEDSPDETSTKIPPVAGFNSTADEKETENAGIQQKNSPDLSTVSKNDETPVVQSNETQTNTFEEKSATEELSAVNSRLPLEMNEMELISTPFTYLKRYDDDYYKNTSTPKKHYLNVEVGGNYLLGWDAKKGKDGQGLNWFFGFNYGRYICKKTSLSLGIQAYNLANIKQPFYLISEKEYGFGSKNIYTRVTSNQLYYIAIPLKLNYAINSWNSIGLGVNAAYLVNAENTIEKYYLLDNEEKSIGSSTSHTKGIYKQTNMTNIMLSANYKTQLTNRIGFNLEFNYGLTDIFKNTDNIKTAEKPMGVRLSLTYTLFDK